MNISKILSIGFLGKLSKNKKWFNPCINPSHNPPGEQYKHICPGCGKETIVNPMNIIF